MSNLTALGEYLRTILANLNITQQEFAEKINVSRQAINGLMSGKLPLSEIMALRLSKFSGDTPDFWIQLENSDKAIPGSNLPFQTDNIAASKFIAGLHQHHQHILVDHQIKAAHRCGILGIENFFEKNVQPSSYDLRVGSAIVRDGEDLKGPDLTENPLVLNPGENAVVETIENFSMPPCFMGRLGQIGRLASLGTIVFHGLQIDSGYQGPIYVTVKNIGSKPFIISFARRILSVEIIYLSILPEKIFINDGSNVERLPKAAASTIGSDRKAGQVQLNHKILALLEEIKEIVATDP